MAKNNKNQKNSQNSQNSQFEFSLNSSQTPAFKAPNTYAQAASLTASIHALKTTS